MKDENAVSSMTTFFTSNPPLCALSTAALSWSDLAGSLTFLQLLALRPNNLRNMLHEIRQWPCTQILVRAQTHGDGIFGCLFVADDKHIRYFLHLGVAYLGVHTLAAGIDLG